ncbi:Fis family transcriptional regulator [Sorangium cellulosum]|uniref:Fis family transcriptional regulator n=1 Tax=Sorangium cellulosum TaxID=56 RepID=A0A2L0F6B9_SORCE|nr:RNA repair transcriptional activator RtcR [Sorangium cellulosum]AUX46989.1 Fis family transcriptional regulator [Sorangium cellulosum]
MTRKPTVVLGMLGPTLDTGKTPERWSRWRPSVALCQHEDLLVDRFELLHQRSFDALAGTVMKDVRHVSPETLVRGHVVELDDPWDFEAVYGALHDFARAYPFAPDREDYLVHITTGTHVAQICLFLLTESRYIPGRLIQTSPPKRHREELAAGSFAIIDLDLSKYDRLASRFQKEQREGLSFLKSGIDTRNAAYNRLIERIEHVAVASRAPILLMGPTGAGKSQLARRIYDLKKGRRQVSGDFVDLNCATIRGDGAMSALFGHTKGSFTGALKDRPGLLRKAHEGVLFLDEIGELGADEQAMLLRAIEEKAFLPVGSDREVRSEFQLLAGTNRDLSAEVAAGRFREDLLARINLWTFRLPGLRDRPEDIAPNLEYELEASSRLLGVRVAMSRDARERFLAFATSREAAWTGNFRDFNAAVTRMATLAPGGRIGVDLVEEEIERLRAAWRRAPAAAAGDGGAAEDLVAAALGERRAAALDLFERAQLAEVLRVMKGARSLSEAGRVLFAASRAKKKSVNDADRLRKYLARFDIDWGALRMDGG